MPEPSTMRPRALSASERRVLSFLRERQARGEPAPTFREIAQGLGWRAPGTVRDHVRALVAGGYLEAARGRARSLRLTPKGRAATASGWAALPKGLLRQNPAASLAQDAQVRALLSPWFHQRRYPAGAHLWHQRDPGEQGALVALDRGHVRAYRRQPDGQEVTLYVFGPGTVFGFLPFVDGLPYPSSAVAVEETQALVMSRGALLEAVRSDPAIALTLFSHLGLRLREAFGTIERLSIRGVMPRVLSALSNLLPNPVAAGGLTILTLPTTARSFASTLGIRPETLSRALTALVEEGVLHRLGPRRYQVLDPQALRASSLACCL